jgi:hypothetical protein
MPRLMHFMTSATTYLAAKSQLCVADSETFFVDK